MHEQRCCFSNLKLFFLPFPLLGSARERHKYHGTGVRDSGTRGPGNLANVIARALFTFDVVNDPAHP